jgi:hypothetical protein
MRVRMILLSISVMMLAAVGCDSGPKIVKIAGVATHKGEPISNLLIEFHPDSGRPSNATTNGEGRFEMSYDPSRMGVQTGNVTVTAMIHPNSTADEGIGGAKRTSAAAKKYITEKYGDRSKSPMKLEITTANENLELKFD